MNKICKLFLPVLMLLFVSLDIFPQAAYMDDVADEARENELNGFSGIVAIALFFFAIYYIARYYEEHKERKELEKKRLQKERKKTEYAKSRADSELMRNKVSDYQHETTWEKGFEKATYDYLYGSPTSRTEQEINDLIFQSKYSTPTIRTFHMEKIGYYQGINYYLLPRKCSEPADLIECKEQIVEIEEDEAETEIEYSDDGKSLKKAYDVKGHFKVPEGIITLSLKSFMGCEELTSIELPKTLENIHPESFMFTGLKEINIPSKVTTIYTRTIVHCNNLTRIRISASVNLIESFAIFDCPNLVCIEVDPNNEIYFAENGLLITRQGELIYAAEGIEKVIIPSCVKKIDCVAFAYCKKIKSVVLPPSFDKSLINGVDVLAAMREDAFVIDGND